MTQWWLAGILFFLGAAGPANAQVSVSIGVPSIDIGIHLPALPALTIVPGSPVYYAPSVDANFFFYDGMYWGYQNDNHSPGARPVLPAAASLFSRLGDERAAAMGRALGPRLGREASGLG